MRLRNYFLVAATAFSLFACSKDEIDTLNGKEGNMTLVTLSLGKTESRALNQSAAGLYNKVNSLRFEFFTADGRNLGVAQPIVSDENYAALNGTHNVTIAIENVPLTARKMAVIANESDQIQTGTLNDALGSIVKLKSMYDAKHEIFSQENSVLTGQAEVPAGEVGKVSTVNIEIKPVSSRLELGKLTAKKVEAADGQTIVNIKNFSVVGIFINQFYTEGALDPTKNEEGRFKVANGSDINKYKQDYYKGISSSGLTDYSFMCDDFTSAPLTGTEFTGTDGKFIWQVVPAEGKYCGYPVLAGDDEPLADGLNDVANIVIKLNVSYDNAEEGAAPREKYLTITGYKKLNADGTVGAPVAKFERGNVYRIENLEFDINDLTDVPYEGEKSVSANVRVAAWVLVPVTPDIQ